MEKSLSSNNNNDDVSTTFSPPYMSGEPRGYALSGKIMLSAIIILFAVVVIMVCLHIYARWYILRARRRNIRRARRRTHLVFYIEPNNPDGVNVAPIANKGLDPSVIKSLPTFIHGPQNKYYDGDESEVLECAVCLSEFEEAEMGRKLPKCEHCFHVECIDMWFHSHDTCPLCRAPVEAVDEGKVNKEEQTGEVVVEMGELTTQTQPGEVGPSRVMEGPSSSFGGRRKGMDFVGVSIEVPTRRCQSFSFTNSDESGTSRSPSQGFKSPTSRILSLKRILSRDKRSPLPSPSGAGTSWGGLVAESDVELGRVDPVTPPSQGLTPK